MATITLQIFGGLEVNVYICMEMKSLTTSVSYYYNLASSKYIILLVSQLRIMCPSGATCLSADCCFSELAL